MVSRYAGRAGPHRWQTRQSHKGTRESTRLGRQRHPDVLFRVESKIMGNESDAQGRAIRLGQLSRVGQGGG